MVWRPPSGSQIAGESGPVFGLILCALHVMHTNLQNLFTNTQTCKPTNTHTHTHTHTHTRHNKQDTTNKIQTHARHRDIETDLRDIKRNKDTETLRHRQIATNTETHCRSSAVLMPAIRFWKSWTAAAILRRSLLQVSHQTYSLCFGVSILSSCWV